MSPAISPSNFSMVVVIGFTLAGIVPAAAQATPDTENGRYAMSPSGNGVIRLDTRTGTVSNCSKSDAGWACYTMPDERKALEDEIGRLQGENTKLKAELAGRSPPLASNGGETSPKSDQGAGPKVGEGERKIEIPLPSDADIDRVMSALQRAWQRLVDMANRMQKSASGKI